MRIHSDFKDYYDTATAYGADPALHYNRRAGGTMHKYLTHQLNGDLIERIEHSFRRHPDPNEPYLRAIALGFCGRIYPCMEVRPCSTEAWVYLYDEDDLQVWLTEHKLSMYPPNFTRWRQFFGLTQTRDDVFIELQAPVFVASIDEQMPEQGVDITTNAQLKQFEFYRMVDPFTAFQDIATYLGNVLVRRDEPLEISDKHRIAQHGYDEWSFRKQPKAMRG